MVNTVYGPVYVSDLSEPEPKPFECILRSGPAFSKIRESGPEFGKNWTKLDHGIAVWNGIRVRVGENRARLWWRTSTCPVRARLRGFETNEERFKVG